MTVSKLSRTALPPRLLKKQEAAAYCGVCVSIFDKACPVQPIALLDRIPRYDRYAIDAWINGLNKSLPDEDWLGKLFANDRNGDARAGT